MLGWVPAWVLIATVLMLLSVIGVILLAVKAHLDDEKDNSENSAAAAVRSISGIDAWRALTTGALVGSLGPRELARVWVKP